MKYAEVCVNSPVAQRRAFSYTIPTSLTIGIGQAVLVMSRVSLAGHHVESLLSSYGPEVLNSEIDKHGHLIARREHGPWALPIRCNIYYGEKITRTTTKTILNGP